MKSLCAILGTALLFGLAVSLGTARQQSNVVATPVEVAVLSESNWDQFAPVGKEVDAIYGDIVLRNGFLTATIAQPLATRHANMTVRDVAGAIIDLTVRDRASDQLAAFYPGKKLFSFRTAYQVGPGGTEVPLSSTISSQTATSVAVKAEGTEERPEAVVVYELSPSSPFLNVKTTFTNRSKQTQSLELEDQLRADGVKEQMFRTPNGTADRFWLDDNYWSQAYGLDAEGYSLQLTSDDKTTTIKYVAKDVDGNLVLEPGQSIQLSRRLYPGINLMNVNAISANLDASNSANLQLAVKNKQGRPIPKALIEFKRGEAFYGTARTDPDGTLSVTLPNEPWNTDIWAMGRRIASNLAINFDQKPLILTVDFNPGIIAASISDGAGKLIPCKVELTPLGDDPKLDFGPDTGEYAVRNLVYSASGQFHQSVPPDRYSVTISHGPEFDAVFTEILVPPGEMVSLTAKLLRTVQTPGWVSGDFHSHSSPSGDNTSSQLGRVLNLVAEQIEFAPCTEHNRVSTYLPHIEKLKIGSQMATVSGIELTNTPLLLCHQNAFPMKMTPRTQDGGAPVAGPDLESQIERLALHDNRSKKLIQVNHPDIGWMFFDRDGDGQPDGGFERAFPFMNVIEVHPIDRVLTLGPFAEFEGQPSHNTIFNWLQLLNQGYRIYGVVNTDAHYNFHGSGWLRNWIQSSTDDPGKIDPKEMVQAALQGRMIMSNGPYLEMIAQEKGKSETHVAGEDMSASSGKISIKVRVQCPNWLDINRVFLIVNGRIHETHDYSREKNPEAFRGGVVKFDRTLDLELKSDAHIIVVAGETSGKLGKVYGKEVGKSQPTAMTNPLFVDIDGNGFQPNQDLLDQSLPTKFPR